jgi:hypothetical protein
VPAARIAGGCFPGGFAVAIALPGDSVELDKPLAGKPAIGADFQWEGVPSAFVAKPFLLTMETEASKIGALETAPCDVAPRGKGAPRH